MADQRTARQKKPNKPFEPSPNDVSAEVLTHFAKKRGWGDRRVRGHSLLVTRG